MPSTWELFCIMTIVGLPTFSVSWPKLTSTWASFTATWEVLTTDTVEQLIRHWVDLSFSIAVPFGTLTWRETLITSCSAWLLDGGGGSIQVWHTYWMIQRGTIWRPGGKTNDLYYFIKSWTISYLYPRANQLRASTKTSPGVSQSIKITMPQSKLQSFSPLEVPCFLNHSTVEHPPCNHRGGRLTTGL